MARIGLIFAVVSLLVVPAAAAKRKAERPATVHDMNGLIDGGRISAIGAAIRGKPAAAPVASQTEAPSASAARRQVIASIVRSRAAQASKTGGTWGRTRSAASESGATRKAPRANKESGKSKRSARSR